MRSEYKYHKIFVFEFYLLSFGCGKMNNVYPLTANGHCPCRVLIFYSLVSVEFFFICREFFKGLLRTLLLLLFA